MNPSPVRLKPTQGFFAAGSEMLEALQRLSDGAFKLFVYLCLNASRRTARLSLHSRNLARELSKSRRSILSYLQELQACGVCRVQPAANQHEFGEIEICDPFWPYEKLASSPADLEEQRYVQQVKQWFLAYPVVRSSFTAADRQLATELYHQEIPLQQVQRAFLLGCARKYVAVLNGTGGAPITRLKYFQPLLQEVANLQVSPQYWTYLRHRLTRLCHEHKHQHGFAGANFAPANAPEEKRDDVKSTSKDILH